MTDKQRIYLNQLLDQLDMKNQEQRKRFVLQRASIYHFNQIDDIPNFTAGQIIQSLEYVVNGDKK